MTTRRLIALALAGALSLVSSQAARAAQGSGCLPTTGTVSGLTIVQDINSAVAALISSNSGSSAPATDCSGVAVTGQTWLDTSGAPNVFKLYDGSDWPRLGALDASNHIFMPPVGGGTLPTLASATTVDLGSVPQAAVFVSGSATITSFGSSAIAGTRHTVIFTSTPTLTASASLILPSGADIPVQSNDALDAIYIGGGVWRVVNYTAANGGAVINPAVPVSTELNFFGGTVPAKYVQGFGQALLRADYPDYLAAATIAVTATRSSGSAVLTGISSTQKLGAGQPLEGTGIPAGATIASVTSSTITMASTCGGGASACVASSSGSGTVTAFLYGYGIGGDTTTVGVPDCQGRVIAGRDDMSGTAQNRLTTAGASINGIQLGAAGGGQNFTIGQVNLPNVNFNVTIPSGQGLHTHNTSDGSNLWRAGAFDVGGSSYSGGGSTQKTVSMANATLPQMTGTAASGGSGTAISNVPPTLIADCIVRVLP